MIEVKNVIVGVDLSGDDRLVSDELSSATVEAIERALWVSKLSSARLHFFFSLDISAKAQLSIQEDEHAESTVLGEAQRVLGHLVERARQDGIAADYFVTFGKSWLELTRHALREQCDLVIVGGKQRSAIERLLIGSTGMNLVRSCPCPVWVTHPPQADSHGAILVGHDLTDVGELALELGATLAQLYRAPLHVVHVIEPAHVNATDPLAALANTDHSARQSALVRIERQLQQFEVAESAEIQAIEGSPDIVLQEQIEQHDIDLLVMGTIARGGIEGLLVGNTAERLLPQVSCSVLAIKPADFVSPVSLD